MEPSIENPGELAEALDDKLFTLRNDARRLVQRDHHK